MLLLKKIDFFFSVCTFYLSSVPLHCVYLLFLFSYFLLKNSRLVLIVQHFLLLLLLSASLCIVHSCCTDATLSDSLCIVRWCHADALLFSFCLFVSIFPMFFLFSSSLLLCVLCRPLCGGMHWQISASPFPRILSPPAVIQVLFFTVSSLFNVDNLNFVLDTLHCLPSTTC